jgi:hypothetical protein
MFWIVVIVLAGLSGFAFGWITVQSSTDRFTICLEKSKVRPAVEKLKHGADLVLTRGRQIFEHSRRS